MTGVERLRKLAKGDASHEIGNGWSLTAEMFESIADQIEREIEEVVADEVADTMSAYEMNTNARWHSAVEDGADSDCKAEYELINRYWLPRPRFEDGAPVQFGDEYDLCGETFSVKEIGYTWFRGDVCWQVKATCGPIWFSMDGPLKRPEPPKVLDTDGVEIKVGDEVWGIGREQHAYKVLEPASDDEYAHGRFTVKCVDLTEGELVVYADPSSLTHKRPEPPDTWERVEADSKKFVCDYYGRKLMFDCREGKSDACPASGTDDECDMRMAQDLVRRCKALAGVE